MLVGKLEEAAKACEVKDELVKNLQHESDEVKEKSACVCKIRWNRVGRWSRKLKAHLSRLDQSCWRFDRVINGYQRCGKHKELVVENHGEGWEGRRLSVAFSRVKELIISVFSETRLVVVYSARESIT